MIVNAIRQGEVAIALYILISVLISLTVHEFSHGYVAFKCGDDTARNFGRLSLNPIKHIDLFGFFAMLIAGFGWAKPVPVNMRNLKKPRRDIALVSLAGPMSNLILAFIGVLVGKIILTILSSLEITPFVETLYYNFANFFYYFIMLNLGLCLFNLLPIPPLDGSKIISSILPRKIGIKYIQLERYAGIFILALFVLSTIGEFDFLFYPLIYIRDKLFFGMERLVGLLPFIK